MQNMDVSETSTTTGAFKTYYLDILRDIRTDREKLHSFLQIGLEHFRTSVVPDFLSYLVDQPKTDDEFVKLFSPRGFKYKIFRVNDKVVVGLKSFVEECFGTTNSLIKNPKDYAEVYIRCPLILCFLKFNHPEGYNDVLDYFEKKQIRNMSGLVNFINAVFLKRFHIKPNKNRKRSSSAVAENSSVDSLSEYKDKIKNENFFFVSLSQEIKNYLVNRESAESGESNKSDIKLLIEILARLTD